ncbi:hypothetical protein [Cellulosimicrobium protaetiae]|uniref:Uncharacterized protein n=1 Tax=Cellulosimicrobium protaetiae TaxID=2587808 RepID=A0A6M5UFP1_9MICO|nr:hypothetical protein [Cellulosimicrobium protaetiae]QJW35918.1 hypothetical protein FIC82_006635 [Cellulosimicrobium protaetiae]
MESASGIVALAVFLLWVGFYVPHRVRHRQQLLEARTDDRFSGSLRVLAVAGPGGGVPGGWDARLDGVTAVASIGPGPSADGGRALLGGAGPQDRPESRTHDEEGTHAMGSTVSASPSRGAPPRRQPASEQSRLALLERRAAAARRRLALTVVLLLASVAVWVVVALGYVSWWAGVVPTAFLGLVLVLGRRAVLAAQRSDAAWLAERRAAARAARGTVLGAPPAPRGARPRVTGRAVHGSQVSTQMIPRVTPKDLARANATAAALSGGSAVPSPRERATSSSTTVAEDPGSEEPASASAGPAAVVTEVAVEVAEVVEVDVAPADEDHVPSGRAWDPVPVPPPTYTMKPTAPRREPVPLTDDDVVSPTRAGSTPAPVVVAEAGADAPSRAPEPAVGDERKPSTETLGLDLNEILARRRAAGQ